MSTKYFNFHNEENLTEIDVNDETGLVTFTLGDQSEKFDSVQEFAEFYAVARNVKPENLKNWTLIEDGDTYAYVLKAGTAGVDDNEDESIEDMQSELGELDGLDGEDEPLDELDYLDYEDDEYNEYDEDEDESDDKYAGLTGVESN